jgi:hypothetical protein
MKKCFISLSMVLLASTMAFSQEPTFNIKDKVINLGVGFGSTLYNGSYYKTTVPPVSASLEVGILDGIIDKGSIGVGGYLGYSSYKYEYYNWGYKYTDFIIAARGTFHYPLVDKLDTYTGIILGVEVVTGKEFGTSIPGYNYSSAGSGLARSWFVGGRYYFNEKFAAMGELGFGISWLTLGLSLKL